MITQETVMEEVWPQVQGAIEATLNEDNEALKKYIVPRRQADRLWQLFGYPVFDILFKTVLGRGSLGITRAIETDGGKYLYIEYAWPDPMVTDGSYTAAEVVSLKMMRYRNRWRIMELNPAAADLPLTEPRAQGILLTTKMMHEEQQLPQEPWILPIALYAGSLQIPYRKDASFDPIEAVLLPGLQHRTYGVMSLVAGRRIWQDFKGKRKMDAFALRKELDWAAAVEFILSEQTLRELSQAQVAAYYRASLPAVVGAVGEIEKYLKIQETDDRYTFDRPVQIQYEGKEDSA